MRFCGPATSAAAYGNYVLLFHSDFIEIGDLLTGEMCQVIGGEGIQCLDDAQSGMEKRNVVISMMHPYIKDRQLVLELVRNPVK